MVVFTDDGFVISTREIILIIVMMPIVVTVLKVIGRRIRSVIGESNGSEDYPGSTKFTNIYQDDGPDTKRFSDISDAYIENDSDSEHYLDTERREKVIFEENISGVPFRYNEKTRVLMIGDGQEVKPIEVKLGSFDDLREFVDRLEDYVNE